MPTPFPDGATLLVGGPGGGAADCWAEWLAPGLGRSLSPGTALRKDVVGGADGVTAANVFEARTVPDGSTALLLPGSAAMAWLVGDPRARFDTAQWVPALAGVTPGLVISRVPAQAILSGAPVRLAATTADGADLPAMLALDLLGANWSPVFGLSEGTAAAALAQGQVDAVCLRGRRVPEMAPALAASGAQPLCSFGGVDESGRRTRDPAFPELPTVSELLAARGDRDAALRRAWSATAAASDLDIAMVLPQLAPAAIVALWRRATLVACSAAVQAQATALGVRPLCALAANASTAAVVADAPAQLALRGWMAKRLDYRPA